MALLRVDREFVDAEIDDGRPGALLAQDRPAQIVQVLLANRLADVGDARGPELGRVFREDVGDVEQAAGAVEAGVGVAGLAVLLDDVRAGRPDLAGRVDVLADEDQSSGRRP
ncbi:MAG: hypothetical protein O7I42_03150 [Alphaproteobacteria bacterium]|nr:hypothetical protein [Alphaproteobacteria bacterium]